jgi:hypothetical protein
MVQRTTRSKGRHLRKKLRPCAASVLQTRTKENLMNEQEKQKQETDKQATDKIVELNSEETDQVVGGNGPLVRRTLVRRTPDTYSE